jgi:hypothetical protein
MLIEMSKGTANTGKFFSFWVGTIISPRKTFKQLQEESIWFGFSSVLLYSLLYVITGIFLVINHLRPTMAPFLPISEESYYFWQLFFTIPVCLFGWVILGGIAYLLVAKLLKVSGSLRNYLNTLGFSFYIPCIITMWLPETLAAIIRPDAWGNPSVFGPFWSWFSQVYLWVGFAWAFALSVLAVKQVGKVSWPKSALATLISIAVAMGFYITFIR